ncbi:MAG: CARDB domain-containing protein [Candidatus Poseidoniaceae archaeon]|nr:CARDB domain-containing protein [Candidatus Poseidoniaceae archaeon]
MSRVTVFVLLALLIPIAAPYAEATAGRAVNIDLTPGDVSITYPDTTNQSLYQMFSSNYPIAQFDKPQELYVTDGVVGVEMNINIIISNQGSSQSGFVDVTINVLHNEYARFELLNTTKTISPISGSSSSSVDILWTPYYSGNHTLQISVSNSNGDDDQSNNQKSRHLTVAYLYDNCIDMSQWTSNGDWKVNSDAYISQSNSFHVGNGQFSSYSGSSISTLTSPVFNVADDVSGHNSAIGYSFFYTGGAGSGDQMKGHIKDNMGNWDETFTMQNVVDNNFQDGISWQTFSATFNGRNSPLIPVDNSHFHSSTQIRFTFTSDAVNSDIGYWIDDIVIIYDQAARKSEYNVGLSGVSVMGGLPGDWSTTRLEVANIGNISARYSPSVEGIPSNWQHYFANPNGASIGSSGLELMPGESREFDLHVMIDENSTQGNIPVMVNMTSNLFNDITDSVQTNIKVLPDRIPNIVVPEFTPRCRPGLTCAFSIEVQNIGEATDVFSLSLEDKNVPLGWAIDFSFNQSTQVLVRTDSPADVWFTVTVPEGVEADTTAEVWFTATSTNNSLRLDTRAIEVAAAIISNAEIVVHEQFQGIIDIDAGSSKDISFTIWNNASRLDIFQPQLDFTEVTGWSVELLWSQELAINSGAHSSFGVRITSPTTAQAGDRGPMIQPKATSLRSGQIIAGDGWQGLRVNTVNDLSLEIIEAPVKLSPGIANLIKIKVTNGGNGPVTAIPDLPWAPESWTWWALNEGENVTDGIDLSVSYDLENIKEIDFWLLLPSLESPGEFHEITISVNPENGADISPEDNAIMFEASTEIVKNPRLDGYPDEAVVRTGDTYTFNATAWNIGNAADAFSRARLVMNTSPPTQCVIGFLSTDDGRSTDAGSWLNLNLGPTKSVELIAEILIGKDCDLNTRISMRLEFEGGEDEFGNQILRSLDSLIMVGERRNVVLEDVPRDLGDNIDPNTPQLIWVNLTSTSTQIENLDIEATIPEGWGILCDGKALHLENVRIEMSVGHISTQRYDLRCELMRESGDWEGEIFIKITSTDNEINYSVNSKISWDKPTVEDGFSSVLMAGLSAAGFTVISFIIILFMRRKTSIDDDEYEGEKYNSELEQLPTSSMTSGPPATGPPASAFTEEVVTDTAMLEYQKQLEEYNQKMAEYQQWQDSQGSQ